MSFGRFVPRSLKHQEIQNVIILIVVFIALISNSKAQAQIDVTTEFTTDGIENYTDNTYTPLWSFNGNTYCIWQDNSRRPWVTKISGADITTVPLDPDPDYTARDDGHHKYSIGIDKNGYIHVTGDMHNYPAGDDHNPSRYQDKIIMYWVSNQPESVSDGFSFVGGDAERAILGHTFSYGAFYADNNGELYYYTRMRAIVTNPPSHFSGEMGVGLFKYNAAEESWTALGGKAPLDKAGADYYNVILWEDNGMAGGWYQGFRGTVRFDRENRLHFSSSITASDVDHPTHVVYGCSDDGGQTWKRADGSQVDLPMRVESGSSQADIVDQGESYDLFTSVFFDQEGTPAVNFTRKKSDGSFYNVEYRYWNETAGSWSSRISEPLNSLIRVKNFLANSGDLLFIEEGSGDVYVSDGFDMSATEYSTGYSDLCSIDEYGLITTGELRGCVMNGGNMEVVKIDIPGVTGVAADNSVSVDILSPESGTVIPEREVLEVEVSSDDSNGSIESLDLYLNDSLAAETSSASTTFMCEGLSEGSYTVRAEAYDNEGNSKSTSISVEIVDIDTFSVPGKIEAEDYLRMSGVEVEECSEGGENIGYIHDGDWAEYLANVTKPGDYRFNFRVASSSSGGEITVYSDGDNLGSVTVESTGDWQSWTTVETDISFSDSGVKTIRLEFTGNDEGLFNLNWFESEKTTGVEADPENTSDLWFGMSASKQFRGVQRMEYSLSGAGGADISIYSFEGRVVKRFSIGPDRPGSHSLEIDMRGMPSGLYLIRMTQGAVSMVRRFFSVR